MGRPRGKFVCPKCGKQGSYRYKPSKNSTNNDPFINYHACVEHFESATRKKNTCYIDDTLIDLLAKQNPAYPIKTIQDLLKETEKYFRKHSRIFTDLNDTYRLNRSYMKPDTRKAIVSSIEHFREILILPYIHFQFILYAILRMIIEDRLEKPELKESKENVIEYIKEKEKEFSRAKINLELISYDRKNMSKMDFLMKYGGRMKDSDPLLARCVLPYVFDRDRLIRKQREYSKKLSESAFGSERYPGTIL